MSEEVVVKHLPPCNIHFERLHETVDARYDAKTMWGPWAYMCTPCFKSYAYNPNRLGTGFGQHLILPHEQKDA